MKRWIFVFSVLFVAVAVQVALAGGFSQAPSSGISIPTTISGDFASIVLDTGEDLNGGETIMLSSPMSDSAPPAVVGAELAFHPHYVDGETSGYGDAWFAMIGTDGVGRLDTGVYISTDHRVQLVASVPAGGGSYGGVVTASGVAANMRFGNVTSITVAAEGIVAFSPNNIGSVTLNADGTTSSTATVVAGSKCVLSDLSGNGIIGNPGFSVSSTTLTVLNNAANKGHVINYICL